MIVGVLSLALATSVAFVAGGSATGLFADGASSASDEGLQWENHIIVEKNGDVVWEGHNVLTDQGKNWIRSQIAKVTGGDHLAKDSTNATYIAVGNGTAPSAGDTALDKEIQKAGLSRAAGSVTTYGPGEFQVQNTFTASSDVGIVNTTSLNWGSTAGGTSLVSGSSFSTEANILADDSLTVTHNITIS